MNILNYLEQRLKIFVVLPLTVSIVLFTTGCEVDIADVANEITLPIDSALTLHCENVGISDETCVLDDPENPYIFVAINEDTKFELNDGAPSAKARFYLWSTAMARSPNGENQYYTALALHELYAENGSPVIREQAKKAYRSILDNYFLSATYYQATWLPGEIFYAVSIKNIVGENLYNPTAANLVSLYSDQFIALSDLSEWGFIYDTTNKIMSIKS